jgi:hypothetical protein
MVFLTLLLIPTLVAVGFLIFGGTGFTLKEFLVQMVVQAVIAGISASIVLYKNTSDFEIVSGRITNKHKDRVGCSHSYSCYCYESCSGSGENRSCMTICQTCYEHSYDVDWNVDTSIGRRFSISRVDRQGLTTPPRFEAVRLGEPFADTNHYTNYIKASPDSLFRYQGLLGKYEKSIPDYPGQVYDYYRINRFRSVGITLPDEAQWNLDLQELNADLGAAKQVTLATLVVLNQPEDYFFALQQQWLGGKKNDAVLVISVSDDLTIQWVKVMAWTDNKIYQVALTDDILAQKKLDRASVLTAFKTHTETDYVRKPMADFKYLESAVTPTVTEWVICMVIGLVVSVGLGIYFELNDPFEEERYEYWH